MSASASCILAIKAVPNAPRNEVTGWVGDALKVKLRAPPVDGKANAELCRFLAGALDLPRGAVTIATGDTSRHKRVAISGLDLDGVRSRLGV